MATDVERAQRAAQLPYATAKSEFYYYFGYQSDADRIVQRPYAANALQDFETSYNGWLENGIWNIQQGTRAEWLLQSDTSTIGTYDPAYSLPGMHPADAPLGIQHIDPTRAPSSQYMTSSGLVTRVGGPTVASILGGSRTVQAGSPQGGGVTAAGLFGGSGGGISPLLLAGAGVAAYFLLRKG